MPRTKAPACISLDFETKGILPRPNYPPRPVSLALKWPDQREYILMAWGHGDGSRAAGNNCTEREARGALVKAYNSRYPILTQYGTFDHDVAEVHWDLKLLPCERTHDITYLLFLNDPHAETLALKPSAQRILGIEPEEQDRVREWILANVPEAKRKPSEWGEWIWKCPYQIVRPYHKGDLIRTDKLFNFAYPLVIDAGMGEAYDRERKVMPILLRNAQIGMRMDRAGLERDLPQVKAAIEKADKWLRKRLGIDNLNSDRQLGQALYDKGIVKEFKLTPKGQLSVSKKNLIIDRFTDKRVYHALQYRGQASTCVSMFYEGWLELIDDTNTLYPNWSQVRVAGAGRRSDSGARSGRIICSRPNFLNLPKSWKRAMSAGYVHPEWLGVPPLPLMRRYCLPDEGEQWGKRDFNQQELRLFAHFEEGPVMQGFLSDPKFDIHELVRTEAEARLIEAGLRDSFDRDTAKTGVFGRIYGQGETGLMEALHLPEEDKPVVKIIRSAINAAVPSIKEMDDALKELAHDKDYGPNGRPIRTWGGRLYYCEPPGYDPVRGRDVDYAYKMLNYLIQPSGADVTKETLIRWDAHPKRQARFITTVYDEISFSTPKKRMLAEQAVLRDVMLSIETDVKMLSDGEQGPDWGTLEKIKEKVA